MNNLEPRSLKHPCQFRLRIEADMGDKTGLGVRFDDDGRLLFTYSTVILVAEKE